MEDRSFLEHINNIYPITAMAGTALQELCEPVSLEKHESLVNQGAIVDYAYYLREGVVRVYYNNEGNEYNKTFFVPGMFPTPLTALISGEPSELDFQALLPCRLIRFSFKEFRSLFGEHRCLESLLLRILEQQWIKKERHDIRMVTNDATANYLIFREEYKGLENRIPQYHIASYLGITPIQLSRIRAGLARSH